MPAHYIELQSTPCHSPKWHSKQNYVTEAVFQFLFPRCLYQGTNL